MARAEQGRLAPAGNPELALARVGVLLGAGLVPIATAVGFGLRGAPGAAGAAVGAAMVPAMLVVSALLQVWASGRGPWVMGAAAYAGLALRLGGHLVVLALAWPVVDTPSLVVAVTTSLVLTLAAELRYAARTPQLFWLHLPERTRA